MEIVSIAFFFFFFFVLPVLCRTPPSNTYGGESLQGSCLFLAAEIMLVYWCWCWCRLLLLVLVLLLLLLSSVVLSIRSAVCPSSTQYQFVPPSALFSARRSFRGRVGLSLGTHPAVFLFFFLIPKYTECATYLVYCCTHKSTKQQNYVTKKPLPTINNDHLYLCYEYVMNIL